jgi:hypothetical protein
MLTKLKINDIIKELKKTMERKDNIVTETIVDKKSFFINMVLEKKITTHDIISVSVVDLELDYLDNYNMERILKQIDDPSWVWIKKTHN